VYSERLLDHLQNPRNVDELARPAVRVEVSNPGCGDVLVVSVRFEAGRVAEARYKARGCTATIAAGSALTEWLAGRTRAELAEFRQATIEEALGGLPPASAHAAALAADALRALLELPPNPE
jgi:nitrogen fixation NifU-like protein